MKLVDMSSGDGSALYRFERLLLAMSVVVTVLVLGWVLWYGRYGIDFTDEGHYLNWIANPFNYPTSVTQFGFIYHPLFLALGGGISGLRQANALIVFVLAWALGYAFLTSFYRPRLGRGVNLVISAGIAITSLVSLIFTNLWLPTPSYNDLALQALMIAATGFLLCGEAASRKSIAGWILIGLGGWLAFMAKPTTAAALAVCGVAYLLLAGKWRTRFWLIPLVTATCLLVLSALLIDGSINGFIERLRGGVELGRVLGGGHTFSKSLRLDSFELNDRARIFLVAGSALFAVAAYLAQSDLRLLAYAGVGLSAVLGVAAAGVIFRFGEWPIGVGGFQGLLVWSLPIAATIVALVSARLKGVMEIPRSQWAFVLAMVAFPHVYAFGSGGNYWLVGARAGLFWVFAGLAFVSLMARHKVTRAALSIGLAAQLTSVLLIQSGMATPYRQPQALYKNDYVAKIGASGSELILSQGFGRYLSEAAGVANGAGLKQGAPVLDLTGQSPGVLYALGVSAIGQAWLIGGYPGSEQFFKSAVGSVSCADLAAAWLLIEPEGPRSVPPQVLASFGATLPADYEKVGTVSTVEGAGGYDKARVQYFMKPVRSPNAAESACLTARRDMR